MLKFKESKPNNNYVYELTGGKASAFLSYTEEELPQVKLVLRPQEGEKVVIELTLQTELWSVLSRMNAIADDDTAKEFYELCGRWSRFLSLLDTLNRTRAGNEAYLMELAKVLKLPKTGKKHLEGHCTKKLLQMLGAYPEFAAYA